MTFVSPTGDQDYDLAASISFALVVVCFLAENYMPTQYGKFGDAKVGLDPRLGWWLMELPCSVVFVALFFFFCGPQSNEPVPRIMATIFCMHYLYRGWIFPLSINVHKGSQNFSVVPACCSWIVTSLHAYLNARWFSTHAKHLNWSWIRSPFFWVGVAMYYSGMACVVWHDTIMRQMRPCPGGERYCIPHEGLFIYATSVQYFLELWAWLGFWMLSGWGPNGRFIFLVSLVNLVPRAMSNHTW